MLTRRLTKSRRKFDQIFLPTVPFSLFRTPRLHTPSIPFAIIRFSPNWLISVIFNPHPFKNDSTAALGSFEKV